MIVSPATAAQTSSSAALERTRLTGGAGADTFVFKTIQDSLPGHEDQITDFSSLEHDHIDLAGIDANTQATGDQAFGFIGSTAFSGVAGQLRYARSFSRRGY